MPIVRDDFVNEISVSVTIFLLVTSSGYSILLSYLATLFGVVCGVVLCCLSVVVTYGGLVKRMSCDKMHYFTPTQLSKSF